MFKATYHCMMGIFVRYPAQSAASHHTGTASRQALPPPRPASVQTKLCAQLPQRGASEQLEADSIHLNVSRRAVGTLVTCSLLSPLMGKCSASALPVADTTPAVAGASPSASLYTITQHTLTGFPWHTDASHLGASSLQQHSAPDDTAASTGNFPADPSPASRTADVPFVLYMPKAAATATSAIVGPAPSSTPSTPAAHSGLLPGSATSPFPVVVVLSPGFLVDPAAYDSYCRHLAAAGVPTITYRKPQESATAPWDDLQSERLVRSLMDWWEREARGSRQDAAGGPAGGTALTVSNPAPSAPEQAIATPQRTAFVLAGHSRGGKISVLAAAADRETGLDRVRGLLLLDPVDSSYDSTEGPGFPSSLPALTALTRSATAVSNTSRNSSTASTSAAVSPPPLPVLTVGLGRNGDCIPAQGNYRRFHDAAAAGGGAPAALVVLSEVGHFQVLDKLTFLQESACYAGRVNVTKVRELCASLMLTWLQTAVQPALAVGASSESSGSNGSIGDALAVLPVQGMAYAADGQHSGDGVLPLDVTLKALCEGSGLNHSVTVTSASDE